MSDATIRFNVDGHDAAQTAFGRIMQIAREAGQAFGESGESFTSSWGKFSEVLGPVEGLFGKLTSAIGPAGLEVASFGAIAGLAGKELFELGQQATATGAAIAKTAMIMNENAAAVSDMQFAWKAAGGDLDKLNSVVFMFEQRMENSTDKVAAGFKELHLNLNDFANATTTDKILAVSEAMRHASEGTNVAAAAFDIFGKGAKTSITELMGPLAEMAQKSKEIGQTWSDEDAKAALEFEHSLSALKTQTEATWTTLGKDFEPVSEAFVYGWQRMKLAVGNVAYAFEQTITGFGYFKAAWDTFIRDHEADLPKVQSSTKGVIDADGQMFGLAAKGLNDYVEHAKGAADLDADLKAKMAGSSHALKEEIKEEDEIVRKNIEALNKYGAVWGEIAQMGTNWVETLHMMRPETRGLADDLLTAGLSQEKVALATGATIEQVKALAEMRKFMADSDKQYAALDDELTREHLEQIKLIAEEDKKAAAERARTLKEHNDLVLRTFSDERRMEEDHYDFVVSRALTTEQAQRLAVDRWYQDAVAKARALGIVDQKYYDDLAQEARDKMQKVTDAHDLTYQAVRHMQEDLTTGWQQHFSDTLVRTGNFGTAFETIWTTVKTDMENIFASMLTSIISGFLQPLLNNVRNVASSVSSMLLSALTGGDGGGGGFSGFVSGTGSATPTGLLGGLLSSGGLFGGGGAAGGLAIPGGEFSATTIYGSTAPAGGGLGGALAGAGHGLATVATFLATNPIGWAIDAGIAALALWNHFSGPDDKELAGRAAVTQWEEDVWSGLSPDQRKEAQASGWANPKDAGALVWMRSMYTNMHRPDPEQSAEAYMQNVWGAIPKGHSGVVSAIQDVQSFGFGGTVRGAAMDAPVAVVAHDGETFRTKAQEAALQGGNAALHAEVRGLRADLRELFRMQPIMLRHAMRGAY